MGFSPEPCALPQTKLWHSRTPIAKKDEPIAHKDSDFAWASVHWSSDAVTAFFFHAGLTNG
jgi:hypothetical protein